VDSAGGRVGFGSKKESRKEENEKLEGQSDRRSGTAWRGRVGEGLGELA